MLLAFELSGEHDTIPAAEALACLESINADFKVYLRLDGCLVVDLKNDIKRIAQVLSKRLSMTRNIIVVLGIGGAGEEDILDTVSKADIEPEGTYSIRVRRIKEYSHVNTELMERRIGEIFYRRGAHADLRNPQIQLRVLLTEDKSIFGYIAGSVDRGAFEARKPHYRPFFYPGVLMPRLARALVNISKPEEYMLDPFCGTGGILIEAGLIGIKVIGGDIQRKLLLGAKMNLDFYKINYSLMYQDACRMSLCDESVDAVVTDPPYGRSAAIIAESLEHLLTCSLKEIHRVLKNGKRAVFVSERKIEDLAHEAGFKVVEIHIQRVHKSLTRRVYILEKVTFDFE
ncbi:putative DNA modification methylase [Candidatus Methanoperedens nitroreducens]|uniref:tRNA (guanine(10)-N(2))-dimethyltransferase n=1 Tax=Candidatus Methanoperedens nitratireducens TaxID=1392998 RepID=A0A062V2I3_9EURY|nr:TRM11 family methyltransferase [Candidatus Methanoperedens nitroreducens]KCZ73311.1 putative DNA modification methylase [Candidatus Methanoperedens nitroreducens]MDJ1422740.1 TRM11 family methyltransferase [Candidatus Methanoperedens sp.]